MGKKREPRVERDQSAIQPTAILSSDPSASTEQREQFILQQETRQKAEWQARRRKALKLAEAIVEGERKFNIEDDSWSKLIDQSYGTWNDLLTTLLPEFNQEERQAFMHSLRSTNVRGAVIVGARAEAAFFLGVAYGRKKPRLLR